MQEFMIEFDAIETISLIHRLGAKKGKTAEEILKIIGCFIGLVQVIDGAKGNVSFEELQQESETFSRYMKDLGSEEEWYEYHAPWESFDYDSEYQEYIDSKRSIIADIEEECAEGARRLREWKEKRSKRLS